ncbi:Uncharacterised protein [Mycobacteroides abscessus subsp. abscessus]|nr:Uncharacterised protein [Mycobacteroides abscessus subsp. abscessus]SLH24808.1 Uncharacterised protein [Mycobacteroides abscessus subsp. abscessus]
MSESEAPLTPGERLALVSLYTRLVQSQNRTVPGQLAVETPCYADLNIRRPRTLSHKEIPDSRVTEGSGTC